MKIKSDNLPLQKVHNCCLIWRCKLLRYTQMPTYFTEAIHALITVDWSANTVKIQMNFHFWHVFFLPRRAFDLFFICWVQEAAVARDHFPILVYLIMRCVCLIVYLESSTSFIDLVPDRSPRSCSPNVILPCDMVCQMITGRCHSGFPHQFALISFVMSLWTRYGCLCLFCTILHFNIPVKEL